MDQNKIQLNIGICEDEPPTLDHLEMLCRESLSDRYSLQIDRAETAGELLSKEHPFQIALLDVHLPETTGIELARQILERNSRCRILFVSRNPYAAATVYQVPHLGFVLKEQMDSLLPKFLQYAGDLSAQDAGHRIMVACGRKMEEVALCAISVLERRGHMTYIHLTDGGQMQTREKLSELLGRIRDSHFIRCHVSFAVNLLNAVEMEGSCFYMTTGETVPISRPHSTACREAFYRTRGELENF